MDNILRSIKSKRLPKKEVIFPQDKHACAASMGKIVEMNFELLKH